jgi:hypothetical protein
VLITGHKATPRWRSSATPRSAEIRGDGNSEAPERAAGNIVRSPLNPYEEAVAAKAMLDRCSTVGGDVDVAAGAGRQGHTQPDPRVVARAGEDRSGSSQRSGPRHPLAPDHRRGPDRSPSDPARRAEQAPHEESGLTADRGARRRTSQGGQMTDSRRAPRQLSRRPTLGSIGQGQPAPFAGCGGSSVPLSGRSGNPAITSGSTASLDASQG